VLALLLAANHCLAAEPVQDQINSLQSQIDALKDQLRNAPSTAVDKPENSGTTTLGGYGEFTYNNYRDGSVKDEADLRRFVLFIGHSFNERIQLYSELEVEHAVVEGDHGELALEQAYLQFALSGTSRVRAGLLLMPVGFLNEYHEPPAFHGVERNEVETRIIPSTWRELGVSLQAQLDSGWALTAGIATSPDASKFQDASSGVREMRSEGRQAAAHDLALFAGASYRALPGLDLGGSIFTGNTSQGGAGANPGSDLSGVSARLTLWDVHVRYTVGGLDLKALYARGSLSDTAAINASAGIAPASGLAAPGTFFGWYGEAAYRVWRSGDRELIPFVRLERYNTQATVADGFASDDRNNERVKTMGASFRLHPQIVVKVDFQKYATDSLKDRFNLGFGYLF
jgi:phosphate-selective porin